MVEVLVRTHVGVAVLDSGDDVEAAFASVHTAAEEDAVGEAVEQFRRQVYRFRPWLRSATSVEVGPAVVVGAIAVAVSDTARPRRIVLQPSGDEARRQETEHETRGDS